MATALIAGATGLVGSRLLEFLLQSEDYSEVVALSRKPIPIAIGTHASPRFINRVVDFDHLDRHAPELKAEDVYCCLGTTIRQAGSQTAFRKVDFDYPVALAKITRRQGAVQFLLVTAMGSSKTSAIFYNRVKGEVEDAITEVEFPIYHIFRPSMLLGDRKEKRAGELVGKMVMQALDFLLPANVKAIDSDRVACAMMTIAQHHREGTHIHSSGELQRYKSCSSHESCKS
jgi:uncharacterized protein YbjT (DUF2867 family)